MTNPLPRRARSRPARRLVWVAAVLALLAAPAAAGGQESDAVRVNGRCVGANEANSTAIDSVGLAGFGVLASVSMPSSTALGEAATASISLSYEVTEFLTQGAQAIGIDTVDVSGSSFPVTLASPSGSQTKVLTPPDPVVDARTTGTVDLGSADFEIATDAPGAVMFDLGEATLTFTTSPDGLNGAGTCTPGYTELPVGFVVDPLAPTIDPPTETVDAEAGSGTVDLSSRVLPGPGPVVEDSWRVVDTRATGSVSATLDAGTLGYQLDGGPATVVWEVCGLSSAPATTTTTETTTTEVPAAAAAADETADTTTTVPDDPTEHCAQGVLRLASSQGASVLSSSTGGAASSTSAGTGSSGTAGGAAVSVTG